MQNQEISIPEVQEQLKDILESKAFVSSGKLQQFLSYVVEESLQGRGKALKAYTIALEVYNQGADFNSTVNPLIRVEAGRLRSKLDHYYLTHTEAPIHFSIPKGSYEVFFSRVNYVEEQNQIKNNVQIIDKTKVLISPFATSSEQQSVKQFVSVLNNEISLSLAKFGELAVLRSCAEKIIVEAQQSPYESAIFKLDCKVELDGNNIKLWVYLTDFHTGIDVWAEKIIRHFADDHFSLGENVAQLISSRIADDLGVIKFAILKSNRSDSNITDNKAIQLYYKWSTQLTPDLYRQVLPAVEQMVEHEPNNWLALTMMADIYASDYHLGYNIVQNALEKASPIIQKAVSLEPENQLTHETAALVYYAQHDAEKFLMSAETTVDLNSSNITIVAYIASLYGPMGYWDKALQLTDSIQQISSTLPGWGHANLSLYHYLQADYESAFEEARRINMPGTLYDGLYRFISSEKLGLKEEMQKSRADLFSSYPGFSEDGVSIIRQHIANAEYAEKVSCPFLDCSVCKS